MASHIEPLLIDVNAALEHWDDFPDTAIETGSAAQDGRVLFTDAANGFTLGLWRAEPNGTHWLDYPVDEYMVFIDGRAMIRTSDEQAEDSLPVYGEGDRRSWFLPRGLRVKWLQPVAVRKIFIAVDAPKEPVAEPPSRHLDATVAVQLGDGRPAASDQHGACSYAEQGRNKTGQLSIGAVSVAPSPPALQPRTWHRHELLHVVSGELVATPSASGQEVRVPAGGSFFVPIGATLSLHAAGDQPALCSFCAVDMLQQS